MGPQGAKGERGESATGLTVEQVVHIARQVCQGMNRESLPIYDLSGECLMGCGDVEEKARKP